MGKVRFWLSWSGAIVGLLVAMVLSDTLAHQVEGEISLPAGLSVKQQDRMEKIASASLFGQFRSNMADFLYLKADKYLHNGVDLRGMTPLEKEAANNKQLARVQSANGSTEGQRKHSGDETTVVPAKASDWRGIYGDWEREVEAYQDMSNHKHRDEKEALPLFRLMTLSNPHFIPGYVNGAALIARDPAKYNEAIRFLREGERNNPRSIEIQTELGAMYTAKLRDYDGAVPSLTRAIALGRERDFSTLNEDEKGAFEDAYRWYVLNRREVGDYATMRRTAAEGLQRFPGDVVCRHLVRYTEADAARERKK